MYIHLKDNHSCILNVTIEYVNEYGTVVIIQNHNFFGKNDPENYIKKL